MLLVAEVLYFCDSVSVVVCGEVGVSIAFDDGDVGDLLLFADLTGLVVVAGFLPSKPMLVFSREGDRTPKPIGGGVAPSDSSGSSESSEAAVGGEELGVTESSSTLPAISGPESTLSGAGVAEDCAGAGESLSSGSNGADDRAG